MGSCATMVVFSTWVHRSMTPLPPLSGVLEKHDEPFEEIATKDAGA